MENYTHSHEKPKIHIIQGTQPKESYLFRRGETMSNINKG